MRTEELQLGIYEKALPDALQWSEKFSLAKENGFTFIELSIDETDERLARLQWSTTQRLALVQDMLESGMRIPSICLSANRRFPLGANDPAIREKGVQIVQNAIMFADDIGARLIQIAAYDEYYHVSDAQTEANFFESYARCEQMAKRRQVMLSLEIMDTPFLCSITRFLELKKRFGSCWTTVYPDVGNLCAWGNDMESELLAGRDWIAAVHLKDAIAVTRSFGGTFKKVPFGSGCVDFTRLFFILKKIDYPGPFLIEMWSGDDADFLLQIRQAREFILAHMRRSGYLEH